MTDHDPHAAIAVADLHQWLPAWAGTGALFVSLPDSSDLNMDPDRYAGGWLPRAVDACLAASAGPTVFLQTDRMHGGRWQDKSAIISAVAQQHGVPMLWHKVVIPPHWQPGALNLYRPGYSHLLAYGPGRPGKRTPDVVAGGARRRGDDGTGMPTEVADFVAEWLADVGVTSLLNPCCGQGTMLAAAAARGITGAGCDTNAEHLETARRAYVTAAMDHGDRLREEQGIDD